MFYKILIFCLILKYSQAESSSQCPQGEVECSPLVHESHCDPSECGEFMECNHSKQCQCKEGYVEHLEQNITVSQCVFPLPMKCENDSECGSRAQCSEETICECSEGFTKQTIKGNQENGTMFCDKITEITKDLKCPLEYTECLGKCCAPTGQCVEGECVCEPGFSKKIEEEQNTIKCEALTEILDPVLKCQDNFTKCSQYCCGSNAQCQQGECVCLKDFVKIQQNNTVNCTKDQKYFEDNPLLAMFGFDDILPPSLPKEVDTSFADIYNFENFCLNSKQKCSKICCGLNAKCSADNECVCSSYVFSEERYSKIMRAKSCVKASTFRSHSRMTYVAIGGTCVLLALIVLIAKSCMCCMKK